MFLFVFFLVTDREIAKPLTWTGKSGKGCPAGDARMAKSTSGKTEKKHYFIYQGKGLPTDCCYFVELFRDFDLVSLSHIISRYYHYSIEN